MLKHSEKMCLISNQNIKINRDKFKFNYQTINRYGYFWFEMVWAYEVRHWKWKCEVFRMKFNNLKKTMKWIETYENCALKFENLWAVFSRKQFSF